MAQLNNSRIALLCNVGEQNLRTADGAVRRDLDWLLSAGYIQESPYDPKPALCLTDRGLSFIRHLTVSDEIIVEPAPFAAIVNRVRAFVTRVEGDGSVSPSSIPKNAPTLAETA